MIIIKNFEDDFKRIVISEKLLDEMNISHEDDVDVILDHIICFTRKAEDTKYTFSLDVIKKAINNLNAKYNTALVLQRYHDEVEIYTKDGHLLLSDDLDEVDASGDFDIYEEDPQTLFDMIIREPESLINDDEYDLVVYLWNM